MKLEGQQPGRELKQRAPRTNTSFEVLVRCAAGEFKASVTNLSGNGFRLRSPRALEPGWEISLEVPKLPPVRCVIHWVAGNDAGGIFLESIAL
jgi:hypothetical protein